MRLENSANNFEVRRQGQRWHEILTLRCMQLEPTKLTSYRSSALFHPHALCSRLRCSYCNGVHQPLADYLPICLQSWPTICL
jgi:hypothetical protein